MPTWNEVFPIERFKAIRETFLAERLKIDPQDASISYDCLKRICHAYEKYVPWHNIDLLATHEDERRVPTCDDVISDIATTGRGGLCWTCNVFLKFLLQSIGFDVNFIVGSVVGRTGEHIATTCNLAGKRYLVESGHGYYGEPVLEIPPKNNQKHWQGPTYSNWFSEFYIVQHEGNSDLYRMSKSVDKPDKGFVVFSTMFQSIEGSFDYFQDVMSSYVYTKRIAGTTCRLLNEVRAVRYEQPYHFVAFRGRQYIHSKEDGKLAFTTIQDKGEFVELLKKHFPEASDKVDSAVDCVWDISR